MVSAAIAIFAGRTDNLFFCNINIYRSTGTIDRHTLNEKYVSSMRRERARSIDAEKTNIELAHHYHKGYTPALEVLVKTNWATISLVCNPPNKARHTTK